MFASATLTVYNCIILCTYAMINPLRSTSGTSREHCHRSCDLNNRLIKSIITQLKYCIELVFPELKPFTTYSDRPRERCGGKNGRLLANIIFVAYARASPGFRRVTSRSL